MTKLSRSHNVADLRRLAQARLPKPVFDYLDGGADDEMSLDGNSASFARYRFVPRTFVDTTSLSMRTSLFGKETALPLMLSPTGLTRMFHPGGEAAVARAAMKHGIAYALSTMGTISIEALAEIFPGPRVFQIYVFRDRGLTREFVARCKAAGYDGLVLTVDTPVAGNREKDLRSGFSIPPSLTLASFLDFAFHPRWSLSAMTGRKFELANVRHRVDALASGPMSLFSYIGSQFDRSVVWADLEWLAAEWGGPIAVKGVLSPCDAVQAVELGATSIILSNHGGRQLDGAVAPVGQIRAVREAIGDSIELICDGGVRRGTDIAKALILGANACSIGRPYLYGLAAGGTEGVDRVLTLLREEFARTLILLGEPVAERLSKNPGLLADLASMSP